MAISIVSHSSANITNTTSITIAKPTGMQDGDILVAHITVNADAPITPPSNWVEKIDERAEDGEDCRLEFSYKLIDSAAGEPANYTFTWSGSNDAIGAITCIRGVGFPPFVIPWQDDSYNEGESATPVTLPVTAITDGSMLLCFYSAWNPEVELTSQPGGMTLRYELYPAAVPSVGMAYQTVNTGAIGPKQFTLEEVVDVWGAAAVILNPKVGVARPLVGGSLASGGLVGKGLAR